MRVAVLASSANPSAPIRRAYSAVIGAPPTMTLTESRSPASLSASMFVLNMGMVVVRKAEKPRMSGFWDRTSSIIFSGVTFTPRSITWKLAPSSMVRTRSLPMSWMSPFTVRIMNFPTGLMPLFARTGRRMLRPDFMAFAPSSISGTK